MSRQTAAARKEYDAAYRARNTEKRRLALRAWRARNRDRARAHVRKWRSLNPEKLGVSRRASYAREAEKRKPIKRAAYRRDHEKLRAKARAYYSRNSEKLRANARAYYSKNSEKVKANSRIYSRTHPEVNRARDQNRRARLLQAFVESVNPKELYGMTIGACGICGKVLKYEDMSIDHIVPLSKGGKHSYANTQPAHLKCNIKKGARLLREEERV